MSVAIWMMAAYFDSTPITVVFLRSERNYTLPIGLETFFQQDQTNWGR